MEGVGRLPFEVSLATTTPEQVRAGVLVVGVFADGSLPLAAQRVDAAADHGLSTVLKLGDLGRAAGATLLLPNLNGVASDRVLLVSLGDREQYGDQSFRAALKGAARALAHGAARDAAVTLADVEMPGRSLAWRLQYASQLLADGAYRLQAPRAGTTRIETRRGARRVTLLIGGPGRPDAERAVRRGHAVAEGMALARDLGNLPGSVCHPTFLADAARSLGREFGFEVEVLECEDMKQLGMLAAQTSGSASQPSRLIVLHYMGGHRTARPVVLIGSGFSDGASGVALKRRAGLTGATGGMYGAASVVGAIKVAARLRLPLSIIGIVPAIEQLPGGSRTHPGDVVTSMSGQTVEIRDDDAEGRLALADALTYAGRFNPACVIDIVPLSGACVVALGHVTSGLFSNDDRLAADLLASGVDAGDRAWRLPLFDEYGDQLRSRFADMRSLGGCPADAITAACFLARFAGAYKWAHLDISGTKSVTGVTKGATGRPVPLVAEFLIRRATAARVSRPDGSAPIPSPAKAGSRTIR